MLETRHSNIEFLGKDGFQWFIAQVAPDIVWRTENNQNFDNGFRAKIRILGYHPGENDGEGGISDDDLPWVIMILAHLLPYKVVRWLLDSSLTVKKHNNQ